MLVMKNTALAARISSGRFFRSACLFLSLLLLFPHLSACSPALSAAAEEDKITVVIDAGHGGEDGGAVGVTGILEKDLNLEIATALGGRLAAAGVRVVYTRTEDKLLYTDEQNVRGQRKMWDLKNRLLVAEKEARPILVSIHMNKYPSASVSGLLTYYAKDPESRALALGIQSKVAADFPDMKRRVAKEAGDSIYLLAHAPCPAVLVECGFLSNPEECEKLSQKDYQSRLSFSLFCAMMEYIEKI